MDLKHLFQSPKKYVSLALVPTRMAKQHKRIRLSLVPKEVNMRKNWKHTCTVSQVDFQPDSHLYNMPARPDDLSTYVGRRKRLHSAHSQRQMHYNDLRSSVKSNSSSRSSLTQGDQQSRQHSSEKSA